MTDKSEHPYFGGCPSCHRTDGYINIRSGHWFVCKEHKAMWFIGSNLFSSWRDESEEEQRAICDGMGLDSYQEVKPHYA